MHIPPYRVRCNLSKLAQLTRVNLIATRMTASTTTGMIPDYPHSEIPRSTMAIKSDKWIRKMALEHDMINPFSEKQVRSGVVSYGLSSYGYDLRVADEFKIFTNVNS